MTVSGPAGRSALLRVWKIGIAVEGTAAMIGYAVLAALTVAWYAWLKGFGNGLDVQVAPSLWLLGSHFWPLVAFVATLVPFAWLAAVASRFFRDLDRPVLSRRSTETRSVRRALLPRMDRYPSYRIVRRIR